MTTGQLCAICSLRDRHTQASRYSRCATEPFGQSTGATWRLPPIRTSNSGTSEDLVRPQEVLTMHGVDRTGVRFVFSNLAEPSRAEEYSAWYDAYESGIIHAGFLANAFRFENPAAAGNDKDPRYATIYDIVTPDPATAWPDTERSPDY